ncbi:T9SS type A sorting domain-containing protein [Ekhidna sp.]|uniref:T9SS type A sorting domain-containing protein n=1 Tax=Ekhidna sp. TaxID=2608089 RepID=UPI003296F570
MLQSAIRALLVILFIGASLSAISQTTIYTTNFNTGDESWTNTGTDNFVRGDVDFTTGASGNYWSLPNTGAGYANNDVAVIESPIVDLTGFESMTFSIDIRYDTEAAWDGMQVEYSSDGGTNWVDLGSFEETAYWYNDTDVDAIANGADGWSGDNGAWQTATLSLPSILENNCEAQFRVIFESDGTVTDVGAAFDNVIITGSAMSVPTPSITAVPGDATETFLLWLQSDSAAIANEANVITQWGDWSGNTNVAQAGDCGPTYTTNLVNGHAAITFDGVSNYMDLGDVLNFEGQTDSWSTFVVFNTTGAAVGNLLARAGVGGTGTRQYQLAVTAGGNIAQLTGGSFTVGTSAANNGEWQLLSSLTNTTDFNSFLQGASEISGGSIGSVTEPNENFLIGARDGGAAQLFDGDIAEIIIFLGEVSSAKRRDIETYLALKYGVTLDISSQDYTVGGSSIFDNATFSGYNSDIAGIGIDVSQGLNQESGISATGSIVRMSNSSDLDDAEFLIWGSDGAATTTTTGNTPASIDNRLNRIWRVNHVGDVGTVDIAFDINTLGYEGRTFNLLTVPNTATIPGDFGSATVSSVGVVENIDGRDFVTFSGVTLTDEQYFTLGLSDAVTGPGDQTADLWLRADLGVSQSSNAVSSWLDLSSGGNDATQATAVDQPTYVANAINGNPAIDFDGGDELDGSAGFYTHEYFVVMEPDVAVDGSANGFILGFEPAEFGGFFVGTQADGYVANDRVVHAIGDNGDGDEYRAGIETGTLSDEDQPILWSVRENAGSTATEISLDGTALTVNSTFTGNALLNLSNQAYRLGNNLIDDNGYDGSIAEVISFQSRLTNANRRDVETYLAIKYGITLGDMATGYTIGGTAIYNNTTYANDIAGIGRDESQGLSQLSSMSISGQAVRMENASDLDEGEFLIWGHDGGAASLQTGDVPGGVTNRLTRIWTLAEVNTAGAVDVGTVDITFDVANLGVQAGGTYQLIISSTATMASGTVTTSPTVSGSLVTFTGVSVTNGDFFTLGADDPTYPGDVSANLALWLDASNGVTLNGSVVSQWSDQSGNGNPASQSDTDAQPTFVSEGLNGNPVFSYDGVDDVIRGSAGFYTVEYFVVTEPSEIYNSGESTGSIVGFNDAEFARLGLGPTSGQITDEVITHAAGSGANYRAAFTSTTANLNQPSIINPRSNAAATAHDIYFNGANVRNAEANAGTYTNYTNTDYDVGNEVNSTPNFPYTGTIAEVISYSSRLSDDDRRDVATYLAIKYGLTLDISSQAYTVGGSGNPIYNSTTYSNDIAGIGINTSSALNQTNSQSENPGSMVRVSSASDLADGEFLVWGNNGNANDFTTANVPPGVIEILEKVWTIEETGGDGVGTVTISFDLTTLGIDIDNSSINLITMPAGNTVPTDFATQSTLNSSGIVSEVNGRDVITFTGVDFTDGDFFTLGGDIQTTSPGGSGLALWFRADEGTTTSGSLVSGWADQSGNGNDLIQGSSVDQPTLVSNAINFNEALDFAGGDNLEGLSGFYTDEYFVVIEPDNAINNSSPNGYVLGFEAQQSSGFFIGDENFVGGDLFGQTMEVDGYDISATSPTSISNDNVIVFNVRNNADAGPTAQEMFANGTAYTETLAGTHADFTDNPIRVGNNFDDDRPYYGLVAEVLSYDARLSATVRRDVESYLALKYGITLDISTENYTADGTNIFTYTGHDFDIAGLGKHLDFGLNQTKSISQNDGVIIKMEGLSDLDDNEYLIWGYDGDTGGSKTAPDTNEKPAAFDERLPAEWRVALTGSPGTVTVKVYVGNISNFSERPQTASLYSLLIDTDDDFSVISSSVSASSLVNDTLTFNNVSFADGNRFTLALPSQPDVTDLTLWLKADVEVEEASANTAENNDLIQFWRDQSGNNNDFDQSSFSVRPTYSTDQLNSKPVVTFDDGNTYLDLATTNLNPRSIFIVYNDISTDFNTTPFTNDDNDDGTGIGAGDSDGTNIFDVTNTPADVSDNGANYVDGTDIGDGTTQARPTNYELHSRVFNSNLSNASWNYYVGNDRGNTGTTINGGVAEIMVYTTALTNTDRRDVESYLALKYGITLDISALDYTYNSGTSIYDNATFASYNNDIAGIGSNSSFGFSHSTSTSNNSDAIITMSNPSAMASGDFLVWGNDNGATSETTSTVPPGIGNRVTRKWGINETNDIGTVTVTIDLSGLGYGAKDVSDFTLLIDGNTDFSDGVLRTYPALTFSSDILTFTGVDFSSAVTFGLGTTIDLVTDTDTDGIPDYFESAYGTNHANGDDPVAGGSPNTDASTVNGVLGDGISDALESILVTNGATAPVTIFTDTDGDGIPDHIEVDNGTNPFSASSPTLNGDSDSDGDGIPDGLEALIASEGGAADPALDTDTDADGIPDYYEVMNGSDPNDVNSPTASGGSDGDGDGISDALEAQLVSGGATAPIDVTTDTDGDGIPDYIEAQTFTDPFNSSSPAASGTPGVRSLQADYVVSGGSCINISGYQWIDVSDNLGNIVFSINPAGNNLGSTCWGVRIVDPTDNNVRDNTVDYVLDRNWYITPTTQPSNSNGVYIRFYALAEEHTDLGDELLSAESFTFDEEAHLRITKITGISNSLDPFIAGGTRVNLDPEVQDYSTNGKSLTIGITSFSSFAPHATPSGIEDPLPVELMSFQASIQDQYIVLDWSTASELNNDYFTIEKSSDGEKFEALKEIDGAGNSNERLDYRFEDRQPLLGVNYYRLRQTDFDGTETYSEVVMVVFEGQSQLVINVYPNPTRNKLSVSFSSDFNVGSPEIHLVDLKGQKVASWMIAADNNSIEVDLAEYPKGIYLLQMEVGNRTYSHKVIKK